MSEAKLEMVAMIEGEPLRFNVRSASRPDIVHLVDLIEYNGNGACSCEEFEFRLAPRLKEGSQPNAVWECRHIRRAKRRLVEIVIRTIAEERKDKQMETTGP